MYSVAISMPLIGMPGMMEWLIIGGAVLLLFGATRLPKLGKGLGEGIRNFKSGLMGSKDQDEEEEKGIVPSGDDSDEKIDKE
ncbi:MAG: twin-arginine translocase TatA/TatE family subunit [Myxococcota bacterium]|nr:twin-arginine translocase TatA/TatE family subunit [Myxococcota bacterium]